MSITRCARGLHFYDNTKYSECPHCGGKEKAFGANSKEINDMVTVAQYGHESEKVNSVIMDNPSLKQFVQMDIEEDGRTVAYYSSVKGNDYVTGWLVCISGPEKGRDYRLYHGFNKLGRGRNMDIFIAEDMYISKDTHCSIVYDAKSNMFYLNPAVGCLTYLNGNALQEAKCLNCGDLIHIGESEFEFVPFCRNGRSWKESN